MSGKITKRKLSSGLCLYFKGPVSEDEIMLKYKYSSYDLDKFPPPRFLEKTIRHYDKIQSIPGIDNSLKQHLLKTFLPKKDDYVLELGAYRGFGTLKLSQLVGKNGLVIAVEGDRENFEILKINVENNHIDNVRMVNKIVDKEKHKTFFYKGKGMGKSFSKKLAGPKSKRLEIVTDTVDNILSQLRIQKVDFISLQLNLGEVKALLGMKKLLSNGQPMRIVASGWYPKKAKPGKQSCYKIKEILDAFGFDVYIGIKQRVYAIR